MKRDKDDLVAEAGHDENQRDVQGDFIHLGLCKRLLDGPLELMTLRGEGQERKKAIGLHISYQAGGRKQRPMPR